MSNRFFEYSILNSPYAYPVEHRELDESGRPTQKTILIRWGFIKQWGRGIQRIIEQCEEVGRSTSEFEQISGAVAVRYRVSYEVTPEVTQKVAPEVTPEVNRLFYVLEWHV